MFDNLRDDSSGGLYEEDAQAKPAAVKSAAPPASARPKSTRLLGMTAQQRFIIAVMLMVAVCTLGMMCMLVTERFKLF